MKSLYSIILLLSALIFAWPTQAASFDCVKSATKVEKLICNHPDLSKLDDELDDVYHQLSAKYADKNQLEASQRHWLKTVRNPCESEQCIASAYQERIHVLKQRLANASSVSRARGKFVLAYDLPKVEGDYMPDLPAGGVCQAFTDNLNEFRRLKFDTCNSRISPRFARFSRPTWQEIPLNLDLAKKMLKIQHSWYEGWLNATKDERAAGVVKMWQLSAEFLGSGKLETMVRLDHALYGGTKPSCSYFDSNQMLIGLPRSVAKAYTVGLPFIASTLGSDLIYDSMTKRYYILEWNRNGAALAERADAFIPNFQGGSVTLTKGATAGVVVYVPLVKGPWPICWINWVPANKPRG